MSKVCCSTDDQPVKIPAEIKESRENHNDHDGHDHSHDHNHASGSTLEMFRPAIISFVILLIGLALDYLIKPDWFTGILRLTLYLAAYFPVGFPVIMEAWRSIRQGDFFSEFFLMTIATVGAFAIGEYPEGVAVMLFYAVGEAFQGMAVQKAKLNIKTLLDQRPDEVMILEANIPKTIKAEKAEIGQTIQLKPGDKLALDGILLSDKASFNTAALTGESKPQTKEKGETVLAGMINLNTVSLISINTEYKNSKLSKILEMVQQASSQKAKTELFIRKFAKVYTPIVVFLAIAICLLPYFFVEEYNFRDWLYRALIFLVISCPCALVISIPLGYFGGIGAASRNGILVKGSNFLDILATVQNVVVDKTGTMTEGVFKVQNVSVEDEFNQEKILEYLNILESKSTHPIATAVHQHVGEVNHKLSFTDFEEILGHGLKAKIDGKEFLAGNLKLLKKFNIENSLSENTFADTLIALAVDGKFAGYVTISDQIKEEASQTVKALTRLGVKLTMLSGDRSEVVQEVANKIGISSAFGDLLPEDKVKKLKEIKQRNESVAFVGDGVNDAPVVALSDVGIAMGGLGSDATIETADVVIQDDNPAKIPLAIAIGKATKKIVWQNIILAFGVKAIVLVLGAGGLATMWEAVFADVGVALLAILNAVRIQNMKFS